MNVRSRFDRVRVPALLVLAVAAASCSSGPPSVGARLGSPADIVLFSGITTKYAGPHDYFAVASSRGNELILLDPTDDNPVLGPAVVYPLSIPTDPHPLRVAAASLGDRATGGTDLLVAISSGSLDLQVIETWTPTNRVVPSSSVSLASLLGTADLLAVTALTVPGAAPGSPGARVLVAATGGRLVVVDFTRNAQTGAVVPTGQPQVKSIGFDAVAIVIEPGGTRAFMATGDPVSGTGTSAVFGVGFVDAATDPTVSWPVTALDAKGPTVALAVAKVNERLVDPTNPAAGDTFQLVPQLRIYAVLDQAGCGSARPIACGIATLDDHGLVADPAGELPFREPLLVPAIPAGISVGFPPASGTYRITGDTNNPGLVLMSLQPEGRNTAAAAAVTSSDGNVYILDLSRYSPLNSLSNTLIGTGRVSATGVLSTLAPGAGIPDTPDAARTTQLGLWSDFPVPTSVPSVVIDPGVLPSLVQVTPGYTITDGWFVTWQGVLPSLDQQRGVVGRTSTGDTYVAIQAMAGATAQPGWIVGEDVTNPALGIHASDVVLVAPDNGPACPASTDPAHPYPEPSVATDTPILPADATLFPGGAIKLAPGSCFDAGLAPGQTATATITVRASGLLLTSNSLGYLGRPVPNQPFLLQYKDETTLTGEALAVARKVRRRFYPAEGPCSGGAPGCYAGYPWLADPFAPGPTLAFRVGLVKAGQPGALDPSDPAVLQSIARDTRLIIQTQGGMTPQIFRPTYNGVLPRATLSYDKTSLTGHENDGTRFYSVYLDDQVFDFSPSISGFDVHNIQ